MLSLVAGSILYLYTTYIWNVDNDSKWTVHTQEVLAQPLNQCVGNVNRQIKEGLNEPTAAYIYGECYSKYQHPFYPPCTPPNCPKAAVVLPLPII